MQRSERYAYVSPGVFRHRGLEDEPEFWFTEVVKRRFGRRNGEDIVRELFKTASSDPNVFVVLPPSEAKRLLRRPRVSDKYAYYAFRRAFVEEKAGPTYVRSPR